MFGIDVSKFQGTIDWRRVAAAKRLTWCRHDRTRQPSWIETDRAEEGIAFAVIKCSGEETAGPQPFRDSRFFENWQEAGAAGLRRGAYHFMDGAKGSGTGIAEAEFFLETLEAAGGLKADYDLLPVVDVEWPARSGRDFDIAQLADFLELVEKTLDVQCIVYTGRWYWEYIDGVELRLWCGNGRPLWQAAYTWPNPPKVPASWKRADLWQFTDRGRIDGIAGDVDLNKLAPEVGLGAITL